ncbi:MAG: hypothetical protein KGR70_05080 [Cyanobacteria bacterium REEB494]|nr:hypothetical protein ASL19_01280 [Cylindrospermopsis sp. CR12]MBU6344664.1 hypothetical protein [Cyanobacteria bacterium REEB494]
MANESEPASELRLNKAVKWTDTLRTKVQCGKVTPMLSDRNSDLTDHTVESRSLSEHNNGW